MTNERMLELLLLQKIINREIAVDYNVYNKAEITDRYTKLKADLLEQYRRKY